MNIHFRLIGRRFVGLVIVLAASGSAWAAGPFRDLSFADAKKAAAQQKKPIFIDFYTTWCGPCKLMDKTTFQDEDVVKWLGGKVIALKVDAEKDIALAEKFNIEFYPTLVFLKTDGSIFERISGYLPPDEFKALAADVDKGVSRLDKARKAVAERPDDPHARLQLAEALAQREQTAEALKAYWWCYDQGTDKDPAFAEVRDGQVIQALAQLALAEPAAEAELAKRCDAAEKRLLTGGPQAGDAALYATVCEVKAEPDRLLKTVDALLAGDKASPALRALAPHAMPLLLEAKRHAEIAAILDVEAELSRTLAAGKEELIGQPADGDIAAMVRAQTVARAAQYYQVLLGVGRPDAARAAARKILAFDDSPDSYHALAWEAYLSGKPLPEDLAYAQRALAAADAEDKVNVIDTVARLMHALGKTKDATALCEKAMADATSDRERWILSECLEDFEDKR